MTYRRIAAAIALTAAVSVAAAAERSRPTQAELAMPQSLRVEHDQLLSSLEQVAQRNDKLAEPARKALDVIRPHFAREADYVFPPLGLLPALGDGRVTPDMHAAVAMADRVKADRDQLFDEHVRVTAALNELIAAAEGEHEAEIMAIAHQAALHSLNEIEVLQPMVVVIGDYLQMKLASGSSGK